MKFKIVLEMGAEEDTVDDAITAAEEVSGLPLLKGRIEDRNEIMNVAIWDAKEQGWRKL